MLPAAFLIPGFWRALACLVLLFHAAFILWVIFGAFLTRSRPLLRWLHIASLIWAMLVELLPLACPLTLLENWFEARAGVQPYQGGFVLHYMDLLVYPNLPVTLLVTAGVAVCAVNFAIHGRRAWMRKRTLIKSPPRSV